MCFCAFSCAKSQKTQFCIYDMVIIGNYQTRKTSINFFRNLATVLFWQKEHLFVFATGVKKRQSREGDTCCASLSFRLRALKAR